MIKKQADCLFYYSKKSALFYVFVLASGDTYQWLSKSLRGEEHHPRLYSL